MTLLKKEKARLQRERKLKAKLKAIQAGDLEAAELIEISDEDDYK